MSLTDTVKRIYQSHNRYHLKIQNCQAELDTEHFIGREAISETYCYQITFTSSAQQLQAQQFLRRHAHFTFSSPTISLADLSALSIKEKAALKEAERQRLIQEEINNFAPPAVVFRIDDHRFFTLEEYSPRREGKTYYNNTQKGIHQKILHGSACLYRGRLIWASTRDDALVFPAVLSRKNDRCAGTKYGCINQILVSLDGGENQRATNPNFGITTDAPEAYSSSFDIIVTDTGFYLGKSISKRTEQDQLNSPWWQRIEFDPNEVDYVRYIGEETPSPHLKTPSGQTRMDCSNPAIFDVSK